MSRRRQGRDVHGVLLLDKPAGMSSNQAVQRVRRLLQARKAGHTGTLDPFATGMLPICLGEASKTAAWMLDSAKAYAATALFGSATSTGDLEGEVIEQCELPATDAAGLRSVLEEFLGRIRQVPPMYSALKHQGQPLYRLARAGQEVEREAREVTIHALELLRWEPPLMEFRLRCSKGTYVRTLAEDIARRLGSCAHLQALRRLEVEPFSAVDLVTLEQLEALADAGRSDACLLPVDAGLPHWPLLRLAAEEARRFRQGNPVPVKDTAAGLARVYGPSGLLGLGEVGPEGQLRPRRVMNLEAAESA